MLSPSPGKRYGVTWTVTSPVNSGARGTAYGSSVAVAMQRAGAQAAPHLVPSHRARYVLDVRFTLTETPTK